MRQRNAARRRSRAGIGGNGFGSLGAIASEIVIPRFAWPPPSHPTLHRIGRKKHRVFAAELVRRSRAGDTWDAVLLGAMRAAYPRLAQYGDEAARERGRRLANAEPIYSVVQSLLAERE